MTFDLRVLNESTNDTFSPDLSKDASRLPLGCLR
jgi:hypothetical protein